MFGIEIAGQLQMCLLWTSKHFMEQIAYTQSLEELQKSLIKSRITQR